MPENHKLAAKNPARPKRVKTKASSLAGKAPTSRRITAYDEAHFAIYLRLLDAKSKAASSDEMLGIILEAAPSMNRDKAIRALASHMKRAVWMSEEGYRGLLSKKRTTSP